MTIWTDDRIPIALAPLPGEALDSWLGAYARRLRVPTHALLATMGLARARVSQMALRLTASEAAVLERKTGVPPEMLRSMTLEPYDGTAISILPDNRKLNRPPAWRFSGSRNRYCPACLAENTGRGPTFWRLPWAFACTLHNVLLLDFCPDCQRPPQPWRARRFGPRSAGVCTRPGTTAEERGLCAADLARAPVIRLADNGLVLSAQQRVAMLLSNDATPQPGAVRELKQLYALAWRILRGVGGPVADRAPTVVGAVLAECGGILPAHADRDFGHDARNVALGTALARIALHPGHHDHEALFDWILAADRATLKAQKNNFGAIAGRWTWSGPGLAERVLSKIDRSGTLQTRLRYGSASPQPRWPQLTQSDITRRAAMIPTMLWPGWSMRLLPRPAKEFATRGNTFRRGLSTLLLLPGSPGDLSIDSLAHLLATTGGGSDRDCVEQRVYAGHDVTDLASTLAQLAYALDGHGSPIDYARRRRLFTHDSVVLDHDAYARLCSQQGWSTGREYRRLLLRGYLLTLLTGEHLPEPAAACSQRFGWGRGELRFRAPAPLRAFLRQQAADNLARHRINEPVTWEPPTEWVTDVSWPGITTLSVSPDDFRTLIDTAEDAHDAARKLGLSAEHIRLYCDFADMGTTTPSDFIGNRPARVTSERVGVLAPDQLRDLYERQQLSVNRIAQMASCNLNTVRRLLWHDGIPLRRTSSPLPERPDITRAWFRHEYVTKKRTLVSLARERGITEYHMAKLAASWEIATRSHAGRHNGIGHLPLDRPPSPAMQAVTMSPAALDRLRVLVQIPGHPSIAAAARNITTVGGSSLRNRLRKIEDDAGFQIIDRTSKPLTPTPRGRKLLEEAQEILRVAGSRTEPDHQPLASDGKFSR